MRKKLVAFILGVIALTTFGVSSNTVPASAACPVYSGYVTGFGGGQWIRVWNPGQNCENWITASRWWTCSLWEWYSGYTCPTSGGGGGGGSW